MNRIAAHVPCEGLQDACFARRLLERLGINSREIHIEFNRHGVGAGEKFVRERYPNELAFHRERQARRNAVLIVMVDADDVPSIQPPSLADAIRELKPLVTLIKA